MNPLSRNVILGGLALVVTGLAFALVVSYFLDHEARLVAYDAYRPAFTAVAHDQGDSVWQEELALANQASLTHRRAAAVHTHSVNMGILLILIGLLTPLLGRLGKQPPWLLWAIIGSAWMYPSGLLLKFAGLIGWGEALAGVGATLAIAGIISLFTQLSRAIDTVSQS